MIRTRSLALPLFTLAMLAACVPARKYEELNERYKAMQANESAALAKAQQAEASLKDQQTTLEDLRRRKEMLERDTLTLGTSLRSMTMQYDKINQLNNELLSKYNALVSGGNSENRKLLTDLEANRLKLQNKEDSLAVLAGSLKDREAKLATLQAELDKKDEAMRSLKDRVSQALTGFEGKGLTVTQKNGQIYVSLENQLLFLAAVPWWTRRAGKHWPAWPRPLRTTRTSTSWWKGTRTRTRCSGVAPSRTTGTSAFCGPPAWCAS